MRSSEGLLFQWARANSQNSVADTSGVRIYQVDPRGNVTVPAQREKW